MYQASVGPIEKGLYVLHSCDNRICVNPEHLFLGTHLDNIKDMHSKGRQRGGSLKNEMNRAAKFSNERIAEIRRAHKDGVRKCDIEKMFNISESHYYRVIRQLSRSL